jgi:hypothetical protein
MPILGRCYKEEQRFSKREVSKTATVLVIYRLGKIAFKVGTVVRHVLGIVGNVVFQKMHWYGATYRRGRPLGQYSPYI